MIKLTLTPLGLQPSAYSQAVVDLSRSIPGIAYSKIGACYAGKAHALEALARAAAADKLAVVVGDVAALAPGATLPHASAPGAGLRDYQQAGATWLVRQCLAHGGALLADEMGLGKSAQTIRAAEILLARFPRRSVHALIVCPAVVVQHWCREVEHWRHAEVTTVEAIDCSKATKKKSPRVPSADFRVISYDQFRTRRNDLETARVVIFDEAHYLCNPRAKRSVAARSYLAAARSAGMTFAIMLTGTPLATRTRDLFALLDLLEPGEPPCTGAWGGYWRFTKRYCDGRYVEIPQIDRAVWTADGSSHTEELARRLEHVMLRRTKAEVKGLPPRILNYVPIELPARAKAAVRESAALAFGVEHVEALLADAEGHKIKAACELAESIRDQGGRPLVLTLRKETARQVAEACGVGYVTGDTEPSQREAALADAPIGVATMFSVMTGINLTQYDSVVFVGLWWQPSVIQQAMDRPHRIGQTRTVNVHFLIGLGTVDEAIQQTVIERLDCFDAVIGSDGARDLKQTLTGEDEDLIGLIVAACKRSA